MSKPTPNELVFSEHDEWVRVEDGDIAVVGISHFAQDALGEIVHCRTPRPRPGGRSRSVDLRGRIRQGGRRAVRAGQSG